MICNELRAVVYVVIDARRVGPLGVIGTIKSQRQKRLPSVFEGFTDGALNHVVVETDHLLHILFVKSHCLLSCDILLQTIEVEIVATLVKSDSSLVLIVNHTSQLKFFHHLKVPLATMIFFGGYIRLGYRLIKARFTFLRAFLFLFKVLKGANVLFSEILSLFKSL